MILFLDIDGVLRPLFGEKYVLPFLSRLERVLREHKDIEVVISSSWREDQELESLRTHFSLDIRARIVSCTPVLDYLDYHHVRQAEIMAWLSENQREHEIWVALDDDDWLFEAEHPNLILVDPERGFDFKAEALLRERIQKLKR